jgi:SAM-dependent methyltransferase
MSDSSGHRLFAAVYDPVLRLAEATTLAPHRAWLARGAAGTILDAGCGTGAQFPYFADLSAAEALHAVEPDPHMRHRAAARAGDLSLPVSLVAGSADALPYRESRFDAVVVSMVLCTVPDLGATLDELARVLHPGGAVRFLEHVHGEGPGAAARTVAAPLWERVAAGCRLDRDTLDSFRAHGEFAVTAEPVPVAPCLPFVRGRAVRR